MELHGEQGLKIIALAFRLIQIDRELVGGGVSKRYQNIRINQIIIGTSIKILTIKELRLILGSLQIQISSLTIYPTQNLCVQTIFHFGRKSS
ncbi:hypothetical protein FGO68_gene4812 [Halteria grandinella]|uniref:Uncharacterized protein n=1 Tax=Halteria grandinella TaxID=5974 RepID=A0A8J8NUB7_HALGN|nr:hypothetical protein FGO68_gene4812 [Halteria grandinella]